LVSHIYMVVTDYKLLLDPAAMVRGPTVQLFNRMGKKRNGVRVLVPILISRLLAFVNLFENFWTFDVRRVGGCLNSRPGLVVADDYLCSWRAIAILILIAAGRE
jgi:hypothetical protein